MYNKIYIWKLLSCCKFCIHTHQVNSKCTTWQYSEQIVKFLKTTFTYNRFITNSKVTKFIYSMQWLDGIKKINVVWRSQYTTLIYLFSSFITLRVLSRSINSSSTRFNFLNSYASFILHCCIKVRWSLGSRSGLLFICLICTMYTYFSFKGPFHAFQIKAVV